MAHGLANVLKAADLLKSHNDICFLLVGDGAEKEALVAEASRLLLENVMFHDSVPKEQMPELWSICDVALVHLKDDPVFSTVIPSKIFEAFGMGKPIMIVQPDGEAADIVRSADAGEWVRPNDPGALANAVLSWSRDADRVAAYARSAAGAAAEHSRDRLAAEMLEVIYTLPEA